MCFVLMMACVFIINVQAKDGVSYFPNGNVQYETWEKDGKTYMKQYTSDGQLMLETEMFTDRSGEPKIETKFYLDSDYARFEILQMLITATQLYQHDNNHYPDDISNLLEELKGSQGLSHYLNKTVAELCGTESRGYFFSCENSREGFEYRAEPTDNDSGAAFFIKPLPGAPFGTVQREGSGP